MASSRTFYPNGTTPAIGGGVGTTEQVPVTGANRTEGWTVAKVAAPNYSNMATGVKRTSATFSSAIQLPGTADTTLKNWIELETGEGGFAAGNWTLGGKFRATTASSQAGRGRYRILVGSDPATATDVTGASQIGSIITLSTSTFNASTVTWAASAFSVAAGQRVFMLLAWEITTASGSNNGDVYLCNNGNIVTSVFTPAPFVRFRTHQNIARIRSSNF